MTGWAQISAQRGDFILRRYGQCVDSDKVEQTLLALIEHRKTKTRFFQTDISIFRIAVMQ